ncbi:forespore regulator of the sigma-K checkpoint [Bacillus mesophilus]|uniref:Regulator n=1 Tax=Bacillus mesophilus TaxID=1808955 RepID=A0A6M0Q659_9BACI|nr:intercompartmental signaling factor BofC [Bacillus mesophilus]MBM7660680.1 forespore regulator of the sigma-K checkpoint [Bacillus mesophilus]NEY71773.1 regulator [Bacillus mesophilus]
MKVKNQYTKILWLGLILFSLTGILITSAEEQPTVKSNEQEAQMVTGPLTVTVILERVYLDGEVSEEIIEETIWSMEDFWAAYDSWQLIDQDEQLIVFQKQIDDISPLLKANGYFGLTSNGTLTIFNGKPDAENVIQSFFQIDVSKLESRKHEELKKGIPIRSKDNYVEVLEVFKPFSMSP